MNSVEPPGSVTRQLPDFRELGCEGGRWNLLFVINSVKPLGFAVRDLIASFVGVLQFAECVECD
jgi:hypothetical protein